MSFVYSANDNAFYPYAFKNSYESSGSWPADGIDVSDSVFSEFIGLQPQGKIRVAGKDGLPEWGDIPAPTQEELIIIAEVTRKKLIDDANSHINNKQWPSKLALGRLTDADKTEFNKWLDYIDALEAIDTSIAPDILFPVLP